MKKVIALALFLLSMNVLAQSQTTCPPINKYKGVPPGWTQLPGPPVSPGAVFTFNAAGYNDPGYGPGLVCVYNQGGRHPSNNFLITNPNYTLVNGQGYWKQMSSPPCPTGQTCYSCSSNNIVSKLEDCPITQTQ